MTRGSALDTRAEGVSARQNRPGDRISAICWRLSTSRPSRWTLYPGSALGKVVEMETKPEMETSESPVPGVIPQPIRVHHDSAAAHEGHHAAARLSTTTEAASSPGRRNPLQTLDEVVRCARLQRRGGDECNGPGSDTRWDRATGLPSGPGATDVPPGPAPRRDHRDPASSPDNRHEILRSGYRSPASASMTERSFAGANADATSSIDGRRNVVGYPPAPWRRAP